MNRILWLPGPSLKSVGKLSLFNYKSIYVYADISEKKKRNVIWSVKRYRDAKYISKLNYPKLSIY